MADDRNATKTGELGQTAQKPFGLILGQGNQLVVGRTSASFGAFQQQLTEVRNWPAGGQCPLAFPPITFRLCLPAGFDNDFWAGRACVCGCKDEDELSPRTWRVGKPQ